MTQEEFIKVLKENDFSYKIEGDKIVVNGGHVSLDDLTTIPSGVKFKNGRGVNLNALTTIPAGVKFVNGRNVYLNSLVGGWFDEWKGNIKGIESKRLLNLMISKGIFER